MGRSSKHLKFWQKKGFRLVFVTILWFVIFFAVNIFFRREDATGAVINQAESTVVLISSIIICFVGLVASIYAVYFFERYSMGKKKKKK